MKVIITLITFTLFATSSFGGGSGVSGGGGTNPTLDMKTIELGDGSTVTVEDLRDIILDDGTIRFVDENEKIVLPSGNIINFIIESEKLSPSLIDELDQVNVDSIELRDGSLINLR